ncbi:MAG: xanthine dehydrogenase family protein molybdopterin-binding subunit [Candidatus Undinarchaeales archaeon]|jgi:carbon-monoxide dehydrogenase large subunit|nr:xanthine dehydrogenase family protein molybdopterin-binding subunit [Candidatus Undinarchaeales archaeon]MDP7494102.1 xanthine dehydrogenase family protein molybdopterin-binding subunit [Candidatus Undinarchaeales archaeon]
MASERFVGKPVTRVDGLEKVTGATKYIDDLQFGPDLLHGVLVESPHAHARILSIDTSEAQKVPGVVRVVTGKDLPYKYGLYMKDRFIFPTDKVRFVGEQVAAVIARDARTAKRAATLVKVEYEPMTPVFDPDDALAEGCVLVHPDLGDYPHVPWFFPQGDTNIAHWRKTRKGDVEKGFAEADLVFEDTYRVPRYVHCAIEYHGATALFDHAGRLTVWASSQSPFTQRHGFAEALAPLGISHKDVRVIAPFVGGGFGGKAGVTMEIFAAALAVMVRGHPVKINWSREQEFYNTYQRQSVVARLKVGVKKDGTITALKHVLRWDAGAYVEYGANIVNAVGLSATGPYRIDNVWIDSVCCYTNLPPSGAYRGFGYSEFTFGLESHMTRIARKLGIDPVAFRRKNAIKEGDTLAYGAPMNPSGLHQCIGRVAEAIDWGVAEASDDPAKAIGKGVACFWKAPAMPPNASSGAYLKFNEDASINVIVSGMEIGQGFMTAMAQIAAEVLSVPPSKIRVETPDTDRNPYEWQTVASHVTWSCGNAVKLAAEDARTQIFELVARAHDYQAKTLYLEDEAVRSTTDPDFDLPLKDFVIEGIMNKDGTFMGGPIMGRGMFMPEFSSALSDPETSQGGKPNVHYTVGAAGIVLEVDRETGRMKVRKVAEAIDVGRAINPDLVKGQIVGGIVQGLATVLYEDMRFDEKGRILNPNFTDYKIPTAMDIPDETVPIIVEVAQPDGPFGARGVGEHPMIPVAPLVANAVEDALGVRITAMPVTAEKVALATKDAEAND